MRQGRFRLSVEASCHNDAYKAFQQALDLRGYRQIPNNPSEMQRVLEGELDRVLVDPKVPEDVVTRIRGAYASFVAGPRDGMAIADAMLAVGALAETPWVAVLELSLGQYLVYGFRS